MEIFYPPRKKEIAINQMKFAIFPEKKFLQLPNPEIKTRHTQSYTTNLSENETCYLLEIKILQLSFRKCKLVIFT